MGEAQGQQDAARDPGAASREAQLDDFLAALNRRASAASSHRLRRLLRNSPLQVRNWLADVQTYARNAWQFHHLPGWQDVQPLIYKLAEEGLLNEEQHRNILHECSPDFEIRRMRDRGERHPHLTVVQQGHMAEKAVSRLKALLPDQADRIDAVVQDTFAWRYKNTRDTPFYAFEEEIHGLF